jgi:hypothetical protein
LFKFALLLCRKIVKIAHIKHASFRPARGAGMRRGALAVLTLGAGLLVAFFIVQFLYTQSGASYLKSTPGALFNARARMIGNAMQSGAQLSLSLSRVWCPQKMSNPRFSAC